MSGSSATTASSSGSAGGSSSSAFSSSCPSRMQLQDQASITPDHANPLPSFAPLGGEYCNASVINNNVLDITSTRPEPD